MKSPTPMHPRCKNRVMLSSLLAMKLELKICFQNQVSGNKDSLIFELEEKRKEDVGVDTFPVFQTALAENLLDFP